MPEELAVERIAEGSGIVRYANGPTVRPDQGPPDAPKLVVILASSGHGTGLEVDDPAMVD